jgi:gallate dioxygenase
MRGALSAGIRKIHQTYYPPSMTGIATAIYGNHASPRLPARDRDTRADGAATPGAEHLEGVCVRFATSVKATA